MAYRNFICPRCSKTRELQIYHKEYQRYIVRCYCYTPMQEVLS